MTENENKEILDHLRPLLASFSYRDIGLFDLVKVELYLMFRRREFQERSKIGLFASYLGYLVQVFLRGIRVFRNRCPDGMYIFLVDYWRPDFINMELDIIQRFRDEEIAIITRVPAIYNMLKGDFERLYQVRHISFSPVNLLSMGVVLIRIAKRLLVGHHIDLLITIETLLVCLQGMKYIDEYWDFLSPNTKAIVTLCDAHIHEHSIAAVASKKGIKTYTLQHGMISDLYVPVVSDKIFVWGEITKRELMELNVPEKKIVISGRLLFDKEVRDCLSRDAEIRKAFAQKYGLNEHKLIVAYFATDWGPEENNGLFKTFASILDLDIAAFIKLRPNFGEKEREEYIGWLSEYGGGCDVPIVIDEDIYEIFTAIDVLVTCNSGAAVEAMSFNTMSVILDIYDYMQLPDILPHYDDCIVVHSKEELRSFMVPMMNDKEELKRQKEISANNAKKYFANSPNISTSKLIADYIRR